jgi:hypothetical protein
MCLIDQPLTCSKLLHAARTPMADAVCVLRQECELGHSLPGDLLLFCDDCENVRAFFGWPQRCLCASSVHAHPHPITWCRGTI